MNQLPPSSIQWAQEQLQKFGPIGATKIVKVPALAAVIPAVQGQLAQAPVLTWPDAGWVIAAFGQERTGTVAKFASTEFNIQFPNDEFFVTNGKGADFMPMLAAFGPNVNWMAITRRVERDDVWSVTYRNMDGAATADPSVLFGLIRDKDLASVEAAMRAQRGGR